MLGCYHKKATLLSYYLPVSSILSRSLLHSLHHTLVCLHCRLYHMLWMLLVRFWLSCMLCLVLICRSLLLLVHHLAILYSQCRLLYSLPLLQLLMGMSLVPILVLLLFVLRFQALSFLLLFCLFHARPMQLLLRCMPCLFPSSSSLQCLLIYRSFLSLRMNYLAL